MKALRVQAVNLHTPGTNWFVPPDLTLDEVNLHLLPVANPRLMLRQSGYHTMVHDMYTVRPSGTYTFHLPPPSAPPSFQDASHRLDYTYNALIRISSSPGWKHFIEPNLKVLHFSGGTKPWNTMVDKQVQNQGAGSEGCEVSRERDAHLLAE